MARVTEFRVRDHGEDGSQYFPGCGTSFTDFTECGTGMGDTGDEALEDALEQMAMNDHEITDEQEKDMKLELNPGSWKSAHDSLDPHDCEKDECDWHHYVSILYNLED